MPTDEEKRGNAIVVDTNVLIRDPQSIVTLQGDQENTVFLPLDVLIELDGLKTRPDIGYDAREAINLIEDLQRKENSNFVVFRGGRWKELDLSDRKKVDHRILAAVNKIQVENQKVKRYKAVKLVSCDGMVRVLAREFFGHRSDVEIETYHKDERAVIKHRNPQIIEIDAGMINNNILQDDTLLEGVNQNEGVIFTYNDDGRMWQQGAIRKGDLFHMIPFDLSACGIKPISLNGNGTNWSQYFALRQLLDLDINSVFLLGGAGTGKTLLALAAAISQKKHYQQILVTRPMVHLEDEDNMGFLPGDVKEKMSPWLRPVFQNLDAIKGVSKENRECIEAMMAGKKIEIEPLDYVRGTTFWKRILIVDEAQNLTPHQVRTIITRMGEGSKVVFTGDLDQIDRRRKLNSRSSGINYAANALMNEELVGVTTFKDTVRSPLVELALRKLK